MKPTRASSPDRLASHGFTLIELMITVAIVALLASIAYPAYTDAVLKGRRAEGRTALLNLMQQQERYLTQSGSYMTFGAGAKGSNGTVYPNSGGQNIPFTTTSGDVEAKAAYQLGAEKCDSGERNECVRVTAAPIRSDPAAGTLFVESSGRKSCRGGTDSTVCWR